MAGSTTVLDHAGSTPLGGLDGRPDGTKPGKRPLPHIDDITSVTVDAATSVHAPVEKILQMAEVYLRQAESSKNFGRPDLALKDFIRANIILLDIIKKNKGWVSLQSDNRAQFDRYQRLLRQVRAAHADFEAIKAEIKADNARTGIQPTVRRPAAAGEGMERRAEKGHVTRHSVSGFVNGNSEVRENGVSARPAPPPSKSKPIVHPKPQKLHGNALRPAAKAPASSEAQDLLQRFANLRTNTNKPVQDPRIRTQPIIIPETSGPHKPPEAPPPIPPKIAIPAEMPRIPDAIYNPPRGTVSSEAAALPSSAPRAMFSRTNSSASINTIRTARSPAVDDSSSSGQYFGSTTTPGGQPKLSVPEGSTISVDDLLRFMRAGAKDLSILLIDVRSREEFDDGHIMSQATICLEPEVLARKEISASQIADSMVLAPSAEQLLFEKRHEFGLIVFYDQDSERILENPQTFEARAISGLFNALSHYDFSSGPGPKSSPKLLRGGLDAWTSLVGHASLQSSTTTTLKKSSTTPMARSFMNPRQTYITRPIQDPAEAKRWEETIADSAALSPIRTTEDFLRRFPSISEHRESMVSPVSPPPSRPQSPFQYRLSHEENLYTSLPSPPTRPPPALPRRSYSGLAEAEDSSASSSKRAPTKGVLDTVRKNRTGLQNPGVFCFANSSLQAMFGTPGFAREVWSGTWKDAYKVPMKPDEKLENPQLLIKCLANLFHWLNQGTFKALEAKTFMVR